MSEFGKKLLESMEQAVEIAQGDMPKSDYVEHIVQVARAPERVEREGYPQEHGNDTGRVCREFRPVSVYPARMGTGASESLTPPRALICVLSKRRLIPCVPALAG